MPRSSSSLAIPSQLPTATLASATAILLAQDREALLTAIADELASLAVDSYSLARFIGPTREDLEVVAIWDRTGVPTGGVGTRFPSSQFPTIAYLRAGESLFITDCATDPRFGVAVQETLAERFRMRGAATFPLIHQGELLGTFSVVYRTPHIFGPTEQGLLTQLAALCSIALSNIISREQLAAQTARIQRLYRAVEQTGAIQDDHQLLATSAHLLVDEIGYVTSWLALVDTDAGLLRGQSGVGPSLEATTIAASYALDDLQQPSINVLHQGQPQVLADVRARAHEEGWGALADAANLNSTIIVPLRAGRDVLGVLAVGSTEDGLGEDEVAILAAFGNHLGLTLARIRLDRERMRQLAALEAAYEQQYQLLETVQALSTPVIPIADDILVVPLVGHIDSRRSSTIMDALLGAIERERARVVILDITGVAIVDTSVANHLIQATRAAALLGAQCLLVGIAPEVAQTIVQLGVDLSSVRTSSNLQAGFAHALRLLNREVTTRR
jgi:anti-anti-sigma factor